MIPRGPRPWTGRQVLIALLLFFGVVAAVNGAMVWIALESWPGRSVALPKQAGATAPFRPAPGRDAWTG